MHLTKPYRASGKPSTEHSLNDSNSSLGKGLKVSRKPIPDSFEGSHFSHLERLKGELNRLQPENDDSLYSNAADRRKAQVGHSPNTNLYGNTL